MEFEEDRVKEFLEIFHQVESTIQATPGCEKLELRQDSTQKNVFYTLSHWVNEKALEQYRDSDFFKNTWSKTKTLFSGKARAYSLVDPELGEISM